MFSPKHASELATKVVHIVARAAVDDIKDKMINDIDKLIDLKNNKKNVEDWILEDFSPEQLETIKEAIQSYY